jgi:hypothetical protein
MGRPRSCTGRWIRWGSFGRSKKGIAALRWTSIVGILFGMTAGFTVAQSSKVAERTIMLEQFGFRAGPCQSRQSVQFLDDDRLVLDAPLVDVCDKGNWSDGLKTQLTVVDLHGAVLATKTRPDVYSMRAAPIGYVAICTENSLELVSGALNTTKVISTRRSKVNPCFGIDGLSPSRTAISVRDFDDSPKSFARHRLIDPRLDQPVAEQQFVKGESLAGISDSGYAVCTSAGHVLCNVLTVGGTAWSIGGGSSKRGMFLSPSQLLLDPSRTEKALVSLFPDGKREQTADLREIQPPNVDGESVQISAASPRRILYSATGCYLGDFDDCYGFVFERVAVFDPQTRGLLFKQKAGRDATSILSPNGHTVVVLDKTKLHIYTIP